MGFKKDDGLAAYNRTIEELKYERIPLLLKVPAAYNRTIEELK